MSLVSKDSGCAGDVASDHVDSRKVGVCIPDLRMNLRMVCPWLVSNMELTQEPTNEASQVDQ